MLFYLDLSGKNFCQKILTSKNFEQKLRHQVVEAIQKLPLPHPWCKVLYVARLVNARPDTRDFDSKRTPLFVEYRTRRLWFSGIEKHSVS